MSPADHTLPIVPPQTEGKEILANSCVRSGDELTAMELFTIARGRLINVNEWHRIAGWGSARFQLVNGLGEPLERELHLHDYIRVNIPGPGTPTGQGFDWVQVEALDEIQSASASEIGIRVRPVASPVGDTAAVAHFYSDHSTSSFVLTQRDRLVTMLIADRNILPNKDSPSLADKLRNTPAAFAAINLFSRFQWQQLSDGIIGNFKKQKNKRWKIAAVGLTGLMAVAVTAILVGRAKRSR